jgi:L-serine/L-threonine ammonia-lyase
MARLNRHQLHQKTPILHSFALSAHTGLQVSLKMECWQPAGSFKIRGIGRLCQEAVHQGAKELICASGGNAGYATAWAGAELGVPVTVVVPSTTPEAARSRIRMLGATVLEIGHVWDESQVAALDLEAEDPDRRFCVHPFDHPLIWDGNATLISEAAKQMGRPDAVLLSVGGGGLLCGVMQGLYDCNWEGSAVIAAETEGSASYAAALAAGHPVKLAQIHSLATTLGAQQVAAKSVEWGQRHFIKPIQVSDAQAVDACHRFAGDHRTLVEPACGAALAVLYHQLEALRHLPLKSVLVVICGGIGVTPDLLRHWQALTQVDA